MKGLIDLAKIYIQKPLPNLEGLELYLCRYELDDNRKDLQDAVQVNDHFTFEITSGLLVKDIIMYFGRIIKFYPTKPKRLFRQLNKIDNVFSVKLQTYLQSSGTLEIRFKLLNECISYIESLLGGPRPDSFSFSGPLSI